MKKILKPTPLNIVLYEPLIPQNTGNIMRTCVALGANLHLIEPLGFELNDKTLKRAGLDYLANLNYYTYPDFKAFQKVNPGEYFYYTRYGKKPYNEVNFKDKENIYLIFGKETDGIDRHLLAKNLDKCYRIPTTDQVRSINLSNAVAIVAYHASATKGFPGLSLEEPETLKGADFLKQYL